MIRTSDWVLVVMAAVLSLLALVFQNIGLLSVISWFDFLVIAGIVFLFSLYRPGWAFLLLVGLLPLETIDLAPVGGSFHMRPYQLLTLAIVAALGVRFATRRFRVRLMHWQWAEACVAIVIFGGFVALFQSLRLAVSFKQAFVLVSFAMVYFLTRYFVRSIRDVVRLIPFFVMSVGVTIGYAVWQNVQFQNGVNSFSVMAGRPNAAFAEPDWLGMFLVVAFVAMLALFHWWWLRLWQDGVSKSVRAVLSRIATERPERKTIGWLSGVWIAMMLVALALVLSVSRSAWLGVICAVITWFVLVVIRCDRRMFLWPWGNVTLEGLKVFVAIGVGVLLAVFLKLTPFPIFERAQSIGGWQTITVACTGYTNAPVVPEKIVSVDELAMYGCRQINLEDVDIEKAQGMIVTTTTRPDPNVSVRASIYSQVVAILQRSWLLGIGWGSVGAFLGSDERGADLNASNAFLEVWLGSGLAGGIAFVLLWVGIIIVATRRSFYSENESIKLWARFVVASGVGMLVFNLFNSGILLGFVWVWLALGVALIGVERKFNL